MKQKIMDFLKDKEKASLKDIYGLLPDVKPYTVRGTLNWLVNKGQIKRLDRGFYSHL
jgi:hypothetical protein